MSTQLATAKITFAAALENYSAADLLTEEQDPNADLYCEAFNQFVDAG